MLEKVYRYLKNEECLLRHHIAHVASAHPSAAPRLHVTPLSLHARPPIVTLIGGGELRAAAPGPEKRRHKGRPAAGPVLHRVHLDVVVT